MQNVDRPVQPNCLRKVLNGGSDRFQILHNRKNHHGAWHGGSERSYEVFLCGLLSAQTSQGSGNVVVLLHYPLPKLWTGDPKLVLKECIYAFFS